MIVLELGQVGGIAIRDELRGVMGGLLGGLGRPTLPRGRPSGCPAHLALLLQLLGGPADDVDVHGRQADGAVDGHVLRGAVGRMRAQVQLWMRRPWAPAGPPRPPLLLYPALPGPTSEMSSFRKFALCRSGSCTRPSQKDTTP